MENIINLKNKVCIITGVGKGFGYKIALDLKKQGVKLALVTRTKLDMEQLVMELNLSEDRIYYDVFDVSNEDRVVSFVRDVYKKFNRIDILINNAGMRFRKDFIDISYQEWKNVLNVNTGSTFLFCREVGKYMLKQQSGNIINMASIIGTLGLPKLVGYGASKGAIISLTKSLALEWAENGIRVNVLAPGFCETSYAENFKKQTELYDFTLERTPMKRWGNSSDISRACIFLASDMSSYITGEIITIDGGWSAW